ncbi:WhiB family transcriptional regulator, partial [Cutibacterium acnes]
PWDRPWALPASLDLAPAPAAALGVLLADVAAARTGVPCRAPDADPAQWTSDDPPTARAAADACGPCPVLAACREYGVDHVRGRPGVVLGGLTDDERTTERHRRARVRRNREEALTRAGQLYDTREKDEMNTTTDAYGVEHAPRCPRPEPRVRRSTIDGWNLLRCDHCGAQRLTRRGPVEEVAS